MHVLQAWPSAQQCSKVKYLKADRIMGSMHSRLNGLLESQRLKDGVNRVLQPWAWIKRYILFSSPPFPFSVLFSLSPSLPSLLSFPPFPFFSSPLFPHFTVPIYHVVVNSFDLLAAFCPICFTKGHDAFLSCVISYNKLAIWELQSFSEFYEPFLKMIKSEAKAVSRVPWHTA